MQAERRRTGVSAPTSPAIIASSPVIISPRRNPGPPQPGLISVLHFDAKSLASTRKAWKHPPLRTDDLHPRPLADLPMDFCKKEDQDEEQRRFRCNACNCVLESVGSLLEHAEGAKHGQRAANFDPYASAAATGKRDKGKRR